MNSINLAYLEVRKCNFDFRQFCVSIYNIIKNSLWTRADMWIFHLIGCDIWRMINMGKNWEAGRQSTCFLTIQHLLRDSGCMFQPDQITSLAQDRKQWKSFVVACSTGDRWWWLSKNFNGKKYNILTVKLFDGCIYLERDHQRCYVQLCEVNGNWQCYLPKYKKKCDFVSSWPSVCQGIVIIWNKNIAKQARMQRGARGALHPPKKKQSDKNQEKRRNKITKSRKFTKITTMPFTNGSKVRSFQGGNPPHPHFFSKSAPPPN